MKKAIIKFSCSCGILFISYKFGWKVASLTAAIACAMYYVGLLEVEEKMERLEGLYKNWIATLEKKLYGKTF
jgi:hypothetical protein